jgi:hypothetical protein
LAASSMRSSVVVSIFSVISDKLCAKGKHIFEKSKLLTNKFN